MRRRADYRDRKAEFKRGRSQAWITSLDRALDILLRSYNYLAGTAWRLHATDAALPEAREYGSLHGSRQAGLLFTFYKHSGKIRAG
jgi:hypothetical protein